MKPFHPSSRSTTEAAIEAFAAADDRVAELSKQIVLARIGGGVPGTTSFGADPEWGTLVARQPRKPVTSRCASYSAKSRMS